MATRDLKSFNYIEGEISEIFGKYKGTIFLDTGGAIDLQRDSESWIRPCCGDNILKHLQRLEKSGDLVVNKLILEEMEFHSRIKINKNKYELSAAFLGKALQYYNDYGAMRNNLSRQQFEYARLDAWLAVRSELDQKLKLINPDNLISKADKALIYNSAAISKVPLFGEQEPRKIVVITSDHEHVKQGIKILSSEYGFSNLYAVDTRKGSK
jgi:hypothetical protein